MNFRRLLPRVIPLLVLIGFLDASYLTYEHFFGGPVICQIGTFADCGAVLKSSYSVLFGIPVALLGVIQYAVVGILFMLSSKLADTLYKRMLFIQTAIGLIFSLYFTFLQFFIIHAICLYCLLSALISTLIYIAIRMQYDVEYRSFVRAKTGFVYKLFGKPLLFLIPADTIHDIAMAAGRFAGSVGIIRWFCARTFVYKNPALRIKIGKMTVQNPIGLSAGYDYTASFVHILPSIGFGFQTVGTISANPCAGNEAPRLGRLLKSQSLLVNKGFRNPGADVIVTRLEKQSFSFPVGISIGRTNDETTLDLSSAIKDIVSGFQKFETSKVRHSYYELNISCPNLKGSLSLYPPENLKKLLDAVTKLKLTKPVFVKMPIEKSDAEVRAMLAVIAKYKWVTGVIFGNLQKDRKDKAFVKEEVTTAGKGHFSGKPTFRRSNELIKLAYKEHGKRFIIVGCGGIFSAEDAYRKIRSGATLLQLITGMIFEGPQRIAEINEGLIQLLHQDGYSHVSEAVGADISS